MGFFFKQYKIACRIFPPFLEAHKIFVSFSVFLLLIFDFTQCCIFLKCTSPRMLFRNGIRKKKKRNGIKGARKMSGEVLQDVVQGRHIGTQARVVTV